MCKETLDWAAAVVFAVAAASAVTAGALRIAALV